MKGNTGKESRDGNKTEQERPSSITITTDKLTRKVFRCIT